MDTLPITLKVKAPNQQIEDQTIKCELSWTINKLKQHLSEVYPSKPPKHEQRLIYSGQLLNDSLKLKDVLRQYDGQEVHTLHLVCTSKNTKTNRTEQPQQTVPPRNNEQSQSQSSATNQPPNVPWAPLNGAPMDMNQYAMQLAWMQQSYLQYVTQYMQLAANSYRATNIGTPQPNLTPPPNVEAAQNQPHEAPAPAVEPRDPENPDRDWLDIFYMLSRIMVLFSVVYFYSSPLRFLFVLLLGVLVYLYQVGFFRNINNNNNNININNNNAAVPPEPIPPEEEQAPSRLMIVWTFFATFFASLIPEIPNAI